MASPLAVVRALEILGGAYPNVPQTKQLRDTWKDAFSDFRRRANDMELLDAVHLWLSDPTQSFWPLPAHLFPYIARVKDERHQERTHDPTVCKCGNTGFVFEATNSLDVEAEELELVRNAPLRYCLCEIGRAKYGYLAKERKWPAPPKPPAPAQGERRRLAETLGPHMQAMGSLKMPSTSIKTFGEEGPQSPWSGKGPKSKDPCRTHLWSGRDEEGISICVVCSDQRPSS